MKPYKFKPYLKETIWGGEKIAPYKHIQSASNCIGESWEISGVAGYESVVADRGLAEDDAVGLTLPQLIDRYKGQLVGEKVYAQFGNQFPLMVKFIDAKDDLSVQVHPNDELAQKRHNCLGKNEMWFLLHADKGAKIYAGLTQDLTPEKYDQLVEENALMSVVAVHESHENDYFYIPAGRVHAIGAGNFLVEIQQSSDITYRIHDYDRRDAQGNPRELHIHEAKEAIDCRCYPDYRHTCDTTTSPSPLVQCPYFNVYRLSLQGTETIDFQTDTFIILVCLSGKATLNGISIQQGETALVPACNNILHMTGNGTFLAATL